MRIAFIGGGTMAEAMIQGLIQRGVVTGADVVASGPREKRLGLLRERYGVATLHDNRQAAQAGEVVVLSVKPQVLPGVLAELKGVIAADRLVLSIVAGARIQTLRDGLLHPAIVRSMPNTPAQVGEGITVWTATPAVMPAQLENARLILQALGKELYVEDEKFVDMATALSGTGPAYVFLFMEAMIDAGVHLGFPRYMAEELVYQTLLGSVIFARQSGLHPAQLRNMVTSPGGTSAEALYQLEKGSVRTVISKAIWAAYEKTKILGGIKS